jgi:pyridoxal phosphate enzyme (YggS family)
MDVERYRAVARRVNEARERSGRSGDEITLIAVSKGQPVEEIGALYELGHRDFGEDRAQEMAEKAAQLPKDIRWHYVGRLQTNKVRLVRNVTSLLHSVDRESLAKAWVKGIGEPPPVLIQVDVGDEPQKGGVAPDSLLDLWHKANAVGLRVRGLMTIPPVGDRPDASRPYFAALRSARDGLAAESGSRLALSMGMTDDFEIAIEEGASMIRVGRAIFGPRLLQD